MAKAILEEECPQQITLLDIAARLQWDNDNGYCGEASVQSMGLKFGAWISQKVVHDLNKGEYLLPSKEANSFQERDPLGTLKTLHFTYDEWDWENSPQPQFRPFCRWMKRCLLCQHPVMFGIFLEGMGYEDYDHIVPAVGIRYRNEDEYDEEDELMFYDLYGRHRTNVQLSEEAFSATRTSIDDKDGHDGCIPLDIAYGIAITGIVDEDRVTLPVHLAVSSWNEPNPIFRDCCAQMKGTITISNLTIGEFYSLLRYSSYEHVPTQGDENTFLQSKFQSKHEFEATETSYIYADPNTIPSKGSTYYRCVRIPQ